MHAASAAHQQGGCARTAQQQDSALPMQRVLPEVLQPVPLLGRCTFLADGPQPSRQSRPPARAVADHPVRWAALLPCGCQLDAPHPPPQPHPPKKTSSQPRLTCHQSRPESDAAGPGTAALPHLRRRSGTRPRPRCQPQRKNWVLAAPLSGSSAPPQPSRPGLHAAHAAGHNQQPCRSASQTQRMVACVQCTCNGCPWGKAAGCPAALLPCCCPAAALLLPCCCPAAALLLPCCCPAAAPLLPCCCPAAALLLPCCCRHPHPRPRPPASMAAQCFQLCPATHLLVCCPGCSKHSRHWGRPRALFCSHGQHLQHPGERGQRGSMPPGLLQSSGVHKRMLVPRSSSRISHQAAPAYRCRFSRATPRLSTGSALHGHSACALL